MTYLIFAMSLLVISFVHGAAPLLEDNTAILNAPGRSDVNPDTWTDSYSVGNSCYCHTTFDHGIGTVVVDTPLGSMTVRQVCDVLGSGPGATGRPLYNDIQCGNGPANSAGDEGDCPGRTDWGQNGCKYIGPKWNFAPFIHNGPQQPAPSPAPIAIPAPTPTPPAPRSPTPPPLSEDLTTVFGNVTGDPNVDTTWADSYSVGDSCYCMSTYDGKIGNVVVDTPFGYITVLAVCETLGAGPGAAGRPLYNDIQCGNGPPSDAIDEVECPGRVEYGATGCRYAGPTQTSDGRFETENIAQRRACPLFFNSRSLVRCPLDRTPAPTGSTLQQVYNFLVETIINALFGNGGK